jgi:hypothetical protein
MESHKDMVADNGNQNVVEKVLEEGIKGALEKKAKQGMLAGHGVGAPCALHGSI